MSRESDESLEQRVWDLVVAPLSDYRRVPRRYWQPVYCWDLDSTVCNTTHRQHMVDEIRAGGPATWDDYAMRCADDEPVPGVARLMRHLQGFHVAVSGRSGLAYDLTWEWVQQHDVNLNAVLLRAEGDHTPNGIYKARVVKVMQRLGVTVELFFEDWDEAARLVTAETGVPHVGINPFYEKQAPGQGT